MFIIKLEYFQITLLKKNWQSKQQEMKGNILCFIFNYDGFKKYAYIHVSD